ncbi:MAG: MFS transporter [Phycisphaerales bacterium]|nr:MFS transporter [Phycisphaerales bacterium]
MTRSRALRSDLANSTGDGASYSFMVGVAETYFIPFTLALGMGEIAAGLAFTIPYLIGATLQLVGPWGVSRMGSPRRWVIVTAAVQCASFVPLVAGAINGSMPTWLVVVAFSLYWGAAIGAGPPWSAWVAALFPRALRPNYFGRRNRVCQILTLAGLATAGTLLTLGEHEGGPWLLFAFAAIFLLGSMGRGVSIRFLNRQSEPPPGAWQHARIPLGRLSAHLLSGNERRLVVFLISFQFAAQISSPFVTSYLIRHVGFTQLDYFIGAATLFATKSIASGFFGTLIARMGAVHVLHLGALALAVHAALFALPPSFGLMIALMAASGACWAACELASFILLLERTVPEERTSVLTALAFLNAVALVVGSLVGGALLEWFGTGRWGYAAIFLASAAARLATLRLLSPLKTAEAATRTTVILPVHGNFSGAGEAGSLGAVVASPERVA